MNWNGIDDTIECLNSLEKIKHRNVSTLVIDNASTDNSLEKLAKSFPHIEILKLNKNYGFSGGMNKGLEYLKTDPPDFIIFMNNDIIVSENFIDELINSINIKGINNIYSPTIYYSKDKDRIWYAGGSVKLSMGLIKHNNIRMKREEFEMNEIQVTDYITGCCMTVSWELITKLKGFSEQYKMYSEDVDLCLRSRKYGAKCYVVDKSVIWHKVSSSIGGNFSWEKNISKFISISKLIYSNSNLISFIIGMLFLLARSIFAIPQIIIRNK